MEDVFLLPSCGSQDWNLSHKAWWRQVPLPTEPSPQPEQSLIKEAEFHKRKLDLEMVGKLANIIQLGSEAGFLASDLCS